MLNYIDGIMSDDTNKQIEIHLSTCSTCNELHIFLESLQSEWDEPSVETPSYLTKEILKNISTPRKNKSIYLHMILAGVATILFSLFQMDKQILEGTNKALGFTYQSIQYTGESIQEGIQYIKKIDLKDIGGFINEETN